MSLGLLPVYFSSSSSHSPATAALANSVKSLNWNPMTLCISMTPSASIFYCLLLILKLPLSWQWFLYLYSTNLLYIHAYLFPVHTQPCIDISCERMYCIISAPTSYTFLSASSGLFEIRPDEFKHACCRKDGKVSTTPLFSSNRHSHRPTFC